MIPFLPTWLRRNFSVKVGMFFLAILVWLLVVIERNFEYTLKIKIQPPELPIEKVLSEPIPQFANVRVSAKGKNILKSIYLNHPVLTLKLTEFSKNNTVELKSDMIYQSGGIEMEVVEILTPKSLMLGIEDKVEKEVPVIPNYSYELKPGYTIASDIKVTPAFIRLSGPKSKLMKINSLETDSINFMSINSNVNRTVNVKIPQGFGIKAIHSSVKVSLLVERILERTITNVPINVFNVPVNREIELEPDNVSVTVNGAVSNVSAVSQDSLNLWVDFNEYHPLSANRLRVKYDKKTRYEIAKITPENIRLHVRVK